MATTYEPCTNLLDNVSQSATSLPSPPSEALSRSKESIVSVAAYISSRPVSSQDPDVWGVLTAVSKRLPGKNILLTADKHCIGRSVEDRDFRIESNLVSDKQCKIYRNKITAEDTQQSSAVFLKATSNESWTFLNWENLRKNSPGLKMQHGDIISFPVPPHHDHAFAFVYREVLRSAHSVESACPKRKGDKLPFKTKRLKGMGNGSPNGPIGAPNGPIGAPNGPIGPSKGPMASTKGPISLDDFRQSNMELRKQLEYQVFTADKLRNENRAIMENHENAIKRVKKSVANSYLDQLKELKNLLDVRQKELVEVNRISAERKHAIEDLNERLRASVHWCTEANERLKSQKALIALLKVQSNEERERRQDEQEKATVDLKAAVGRAQSEIQEELQRLSVVALKQEKEQRELFNKLEESLRKPSSQVDGLVSKLEDTKQNLVNSCNKVRQLETQVCEAQQVSANARKKVEELEHEMKGLRKELETEKAAREQAWAKVSALELEINAAMQDQGAWERTILRETQLPAFCPTSEEILVMSANLGIECVLETENLGGDTMSDSSCMVAESQGMPSSDATAAARHNGECQALRKMIGLVAPALKEQFRHVPADSFDQQRKKQCNTFDSRYLGLC